jgi:hypothetical protein
MNREEVLQQMNVAEFVGRMKEQANRIERLAALSAEASDDMRVACFTLVESELDMLQRRIGLTREWLNTQ